MWSIDIGKTKAPPKSAKVLAVEERACKNGSEDSTIPEKVVRRRGSRKSPEHRRMFTEERIRR